jgi:hypothetical protein
MKDTYRYFIHAYEDAKWKRPLTHRHGGTTVLTDRAGALGRAELLANEFPLPSVLEVDVDPPIGE